MSSTYSMLIKTLFASFLLMIVGCAKNEAMSPQPTQASESAHPAPCRSIVGVGLPDPSLVSTHVLYQSYSKASKEQIWAISVKDGSRKLVFDGGSYLGLGFLKDGYQFVLPAGDGEALLSNLDGTVIKNVPNDEILDNFLPYTFVWSLFADPHKYPDAKDYAIGRWHSSDNRKIAVWKEGDKSLLIVDRISNKKIPIIQTDMHEIIAGNWSPDGKEFAFIFEQARDDFYTQLFLVGADGKNLRPVTGRFEETTAFQPYWSPDGKKVAFHVLDFIQWPYETFKILDVDSGELKVFSTGAPTQPSLMAENHWIWSPNSKWLLYFTSWGQVDMRAINVENGENYCITNDALVEQMMDWK